MEKRILDSVHGHIRICDSYFNDIIDTPEFQRLRRIEQTAIRSLYPSARHDRFIHSLGVYYIGNEIVSHFQRNESYKNWGIGKDCFDAICKSYLYACLLHDVGHAPFSHTFEKYYGKKADLLKELSKLINSATFSTDMVEHQDNANFHEYVSAYVAYARFSHVFKKEKCDPEYVARMIVGCFYKDIDSPENQIKNCFISLLHGDLVDADRMDYACRDVWASGYSTSVIDIHRLINSIHIRKNKDDEFVVCFYCNVVNEIENLMTIKDFQIKYVLNHHSVVYDQYLLTQAVEHSAKKLFEDEVKKANPAINDQDLKILCMNKLCSIQSMIAEVKIGNLRIYNPTDDDFISIVKQDETNEYYKEWVSRKYKFFALWKSQEEFAHYFGIKKGVNLKTSNFKNEIESILAGKGFKKDDYIIHTVVYKPKVKLSSLYILVHNELERFTDIYQEDDQKSAAVEFYYVFVNKEKAASFNNIEHFRNNLIANIKNEVQSLFAVPKVQSS